MAIDTRRVKECVGQHLVEINTVEDVARRLYASPVTLRRTFQRREGMTLSEYIRAEKIARAKILIETTEMSCAEVCYALGWRPDSGARTFKRYENMTMTEYRESLRHFIHRSGARISREDNMPIIAA